jgi:hypothetical protein
MPSMLPSVDPSPGPSYSPSNGPSQGPTASPSSSPSKVATASPSNSPSGTPSESPSSDCNHPGQLSDSPSASPSESPTVQILSALPPSNNNIVIGTSQPSQLPSTSPSSSPTTFPSAGPTGLDFPSQPTSEIPSTYPSVHPSDSPTATLSSSPSVSPSRKPSISPSDTPSVLPSSSPSSEPSEDPSASPIEIPSASPSTYPSVHPSNFPMATPSSSPSVSTSETPSISPSDTPTVLPSSFPSVSPSEAPSVSPTVIPSAQPSASPSNKPCEISVQMDCTTVDGRSCDDLTGEPAIECNCAEGCARELTYRYTAASCDAELSGCSDSSSLPTEAYIVFESSTGTLFEGMVQVNDDISITNNGGCIPDNLQVSIKGALSDPQATQTVTVNSFCGGSAVTLLDKFGALEFAGYTCADNVPHLCYTDVEYNITTTNIGASTQVVSSWNFELNGESREAGMPLPTLEPEEGFSKLETAEIVLCMDSEYLATADSIANGMGGGEQCLSAAPIFFAITAGTKAPTNSPSASPTLPPSASPSEAPSVSPTDIPSAQPSASPSNSPCEIAVQMDCTTVDGRSCDDLTGEPAIECNCAEGCARELTYRYTAASCDAELSNCSDSSSLPTEAYIVFESSAGTLFEGMVQVNDDISITNNGACIPDNLQVSVLAASGAQAAQAVIVNSFCGGSAVTLLDKFGALEFASYTCADNVPHLCYIDVEYNITTTNIGASTQVVSSWNFELNGESREAGMPLPTLEPEEGFSKLETAEIVLCMDSEYLATADSIANGMGGGEQCLSAAPIFFAITAGTKAPTTSPSASPTLPPSASPSEAPSASPSEAPSVSPTDIPSAQPSASPSNSPCEIAVQMDCTTVDGRSCDDLTGEPAIECNCAEGCARELTYRYTAASCDAELSNCSDSSSLPTEAYIVFESSAGTLFEGMVQVNDDISITNNGGCIPDNLQVSIKGALSDPQAAQTVTVNSFCGGSAVTLLDKFGALEFASYTCADNVPHLCYIDVEYNITTTNIGASTQVVSSWNFELNGESREAGMPLPTLEPEEGFSKLETAEIVLCMDSEYLATADSIANGMGGGEQCLSAAPIFFAITAGTKAPTTSPSASPTLPPSASPSEAPSASPSEAPSVSPTDIPSAQPSASPSNSPCEIAVQMDCTTVDGRSCDDLTGEPAIECNCAEGCARELTYRYTAASCDAELSNCSDSSSLPTEAYIVFESSAGTLFEGMVQVNDDISITNNGGCIPDNLQVSIKGALSDPQAAQTVTVNSFCGGSAVTLLDKFGALEFASYTCADNVPHLCYIDVEYNITTTNIGASTQVVSSWNFELNGESREAGMPLPTLEPEEGFSTLAFVEIVLCMDSEYLATADSIAYGLGADEKCMSTSPFNFAITAGTKAPTTSPSAEPTQVPLAIVELPPDFGLFEAVPSASPSQAPSSMPSRMPSPWPSVRPSSMPSRQPSSKPVYLSLAPTFNPTTLEPSPTPSAAPTGSPSAMPSRTPSFSPTTLTPTASPILYATLQPASNSATKTLSPRRTPSPVNTPDLPVHNTFSGDTNFGPCVGDSEEGLFGWGNEEEKRLLTFMFELETRPDTTASDVLELLDQAFMRNILPALFPDQCEADNNRQRERSLRHLMVVGVSTFPQDDITECK